MEPDYWNIPQSGGDDGAASHREGFMMPSFFRLSYHGSTFLFKSWAPASPTTYALSLLALLLMALFREWLLQVKHTLHQHHLHLQANSAHKQHLPKTSTTSSSSNGSDTRYTAVSTSSDAPPEAAMANNAAPTAQPAMLILKLVIAKMTKNGKAYTYKHLGWFALLFFVHTLRVATTYFLMLAVMSYNLGVFIAILAGLGLGFLIFPIPHAPTSPSHPPPLPPTAPSPPPYSNRNSPTQKTVPTIKSPFSNSSLSVLLKQNVSIRLAKVLSRSPLSPIVSPPEGEEATSSFEA